MANPLFLALDTPSVEQALAWTTAVRRHIGGVKVGLELFGAAGPQGLRRIAEVGLPVFLDLKFHDIPNTVGKAVAAVAPLNPFILTVHAQGGEAMMRAARAAAPASCRVVAVTVLTSLDDADLSTLGMPTALSLKSRGLPRSHGRRPWTAWCVPARKWRPGGWRGRTGCSWCPDCGPRAEPRRTRSAP